MLIGTRILHLRDGADRTDVPVQLFAPERGQDGGWMCRYRIDWPHGLRESEGCGEDAIQALLLTLQKIGADIYASAYHQAGQLVLGEPGRGYGFPVPRNGRHLLVGDDALFL
jgi:hypothetical protein